MGSLRAGSIAGSRARIVVGLRLTTLCRGVTAAAFARRPRHGALLAGGDAQPLDAPRIGIEHLDLEIARAGNDFAADRQAAEMGHEIAAEGFDFFAGLAGDELRTD